MGYHRFLALMPVPLAPLYKGEIRLLFYPLSMQFYSVLSTPFSILSPLTLMVNQALSCSKTKVFPSYPGPYSSPMDVQTLPDSKHIVYDCVCTYTSSVVYYLYLFAQ